MEENNFNVNTLPISTLGKAIIRQAKNKNTYLVSIGLLPIILLTASLTLLLLTKPSIYFFTFNPAIIKSSILPSKTPYTSLVS